MSDNAPLEIMDAAAAGKPKDLAKWIEINRSIRGIPYDLIAELIRNSRGCSKIITMMEDELIRYGEDISKNGKKERYIAYKTGSFSHIFKPKTKEKKRKEEGLKTIFNTRNAKRDESILLRYQELKNKPKELALHQLGIEYHLSPSTIETIIAQRKKAKREAEETWENSIVKATHNTFP